VGVTFVYVTHDQEEAMVLSDRIAVMNNGRVSQEGTPREIYHHPADRFVAGFIGESNFFDGKVREIADGRVMVELLGFAAPASVSANHLSHQVMTRLRQGDPVTIMVRPEHVTWQSAPDGSLDNVAEAWVRESAFLGMYTQIVAELQDGMTIKLHQAGGDSEGTMSHDLAGQRIYIGWKAHHGRLLVD
jgi:ABC-type Fe3+/spermidine/putrescine transport system ATPase subunit